METEAKKETESVITRGEEIERTRKFFEGDRFAVENGAVIEAIGDHYARCSMKVEPKPLPWRQTGRKWEPFLSPAISPSAGRPKGTACTRRPSAKRMEEAPVSMRLM